jgi:peptidoglycan/LPS O-acetylase OafA/YrhL
MTIFNLKPKTAFILTFIAINIIIIVNLYFHKGYEEGYYIYFLIASAVGACMIWILSDIKYILNVLFTGITIAYIILFASLFWNYMDKPWFKPLRKNCDGPCYGWFSFENELNWSLLILYGCAAAIVTLLVKLGVRKLYSSNLKPEND